jgi:hypothetical protein
MSDFVSDTPQVFGDSHGLLKYLAAVGQPRMSGTGVAAITWAAGPAFLAAASRSR